MAEKDVPIKVDEDAAARVKELGFQREFEQMLEHARQTARGLRGIHAKLEYDPACPHNEPGIVIWVYHDVPPEGPEADRTSWDWSSWRIATFPPAPCAHISMIPAYGAPDGW